VIISPVKASAVSKKKKEESVPAAPVTTPA
jgi:hypothetical protein